MLKNSRFGRAAACRRTRLNILVLSASFTAFSPVYAANELGSSSGGDSESIQTAVLVNGQGGEISLSLPNFTSADSAQPMFALQPAAPFAAKYLDLGQSVKTIAKHQSALFAVTDNNSLLTINFVDHSPKVLNTITLADPVTVMRAVDDLLLIGTATGELLIYNINTDNLKLRHRVKLGSYSSKTAKQSAAITAISSQGNMAYVLINHQQLQILRLGSSVKKLARMELDNHFNAINIKDHYCYLSGDELGLQIIDVSNIKKPVLLDGFATQGSGQDIKIEDNLAYVADGQGGLVVFDISDPRRIKWLGSHSKLGAVNQVTVYNGMAIINNDFNRLASLEIADATLPITGSLFKPRDRINDSLVDWPYVYVAESQGIEQVDFSIGAAIQISNEGINQGGSRRAFIRDNIAYVADWFSGLHMYDISIPRAPRHLGNFHTAGSSKGVVVKDHYAFVGDDDHGLQVIDISNPRQPQKIAEVATRGLAYTMKLVDNLIYLADHRGGFDIIDITDVHAPKVIGSFDTPGKSWAMDVVDGVAYVADDSTGLLVFDVRNPKAISLIGQFNPGGYAEDIKIQDHYAYVAFFDKGFYILDISNPREPQITGHTPIPGNARSVVLEGSYAYLAGWESGMQVVDISNLAAPKIVAHYDTDGSAWGVDVYKNYAYIWDWWGGIKVINISNPLQPQLVGQYQARGLIQSLAIRGNYAYAASGAGGLQVYDIRNPLNPIWTTGLDIAGSVRDVALADNKAYLAADDDGVIIADISNPFYVHWLGRLKTPGKVQRIVVNKSVAIVQDSQAGLLVLDVSQSDMPHIKSRAWMATNDLWLQNQRLFVTSSQGLTVYQITSQFQLQRIATYSVTKTAPDTEHNQPDWVRTSGDIIYLHEKGKGIHILKLQDGDLTSLGFFAFSAPLEDMQIYANHLYVACESAGILDIDVTNPATPALSVEYPATSHMAKIAINEQAIFLAGDKSINSVTRLADIAVKTSAKNDIKMRLPGSLPLGDYQLTFLQLNGDRQVLGDAVTVKPPKRKKPKFTMEDFKKILEQQKLNSQKSAP